MQQDKQEQKQETQGPTPKVKRSNTLLTEELPAGGLTQEEFKHVGHNLAEVDDDEDEDGSAD